MADPVDPRWWETIGAVVGGGLAILLGKRGVERVRERNGSGNGKQNGAEVRCQAVDLTSALNRMADISEHIAAGQDEARRELAAIRLEAAGQYARTTAVLEQVQRALERTR